MFSRIYIFYKVPKLKMTRLFPTVRFNVLLILPFIFIIHFFVHDVVSEKILFILPIATKSHAIIFHPLMKALGEKGHEITAITNVKSSSMPETVEDIIARPREEIFSQIENFFERRKSGIGGRFGAMKVDFVEDTVRAVYEHPNVIEILENKKNYYDLVVLDILGHNGVYGIAAHMNAPIIGIVTFPATNDLVGNLGHHFPPSFIPDPMLSFSDRMSFSERMANTVFQWIFPAIGKWLIVSKWESLNKEYLGENIPSNQQIEANFSLLMMNSHFTMTYPRPLNPDIIEIGGLHCKPPKPLPQDLEEMISSSNDGVIYFSLGTIIEGMPEEYRKIFVNVFSKLKQKVLWKWNGGDMPDLPSNVKLIKWAPQQDILGHKNVRLFITHGGMFSTQEAVYHGVPSLSIPIFGDQDLNAKLAENAGYALMLEITEMTEEILSDKIHRLLHEKKFYKRAKELSIIFQDRPVHPLNTAVYWAEYVMRHKGAKHLRSASRELNSFQYHSLDVILVLALSLLLTLVALKVSLSKLISCFRRKLLENNCHNYNNVKTPKKTN